MRRSFWLRMGFIAVAGLALACGKTAVADESAPNPNPRRTRDAISHDELNQMPALNLYEVVQRIHPEWLVARNQATVGGRNSQTASGQSGVQVYIDTQRLGNVEMLRQISVNAAASLKYYSSSEAQSRFGVGNTSGAIQIISAATRK